MKPTFDTVLLVLLAIAVASSGCDVCEPGETQACVCADGASGAQVCADDWIGYHGKSFLVRMLSSRGGYSLVSYTDDNHVTLTSVDGYSVDLETSAVLDTGETLRLYDFHDLGLSYSEDIWLHVTADEPVSAVFGMFSCNGGTQVYSGDMEEYYFSYYGPVRLFVTAGSSSAVVSWSDLESTESDLVAIPAGDLYEYYGGSTGWHTIHLESDEPVVVEIEDSCAGFSPAIQYSSDDLPGGVGSEYYVRASNAAQTRIVSLADANTIELSGCNLGTIVLDENAYATPSGCNSQDVLHAVGDGDFVLEMSHSTENATAWIPIF